MKKRELNFELLRVIAMIMIIVLHYLSKGDVLKPLAEDISLKNQFFWLLESFAIVAVNCYVLISGYFLVEAQWSLKRLVNLLLQVLFYSLLIPVGCIALGIVKVSELSVYDFAGYLFPVGSECYWFVTAYVVMYLFAPILSQGVKAISQKQFSVILICLIGFFSIEKTILPMALPTDRMGYDFGWFLCLFLVAAYVRLYGHRLVAGKKQSLLLYISSCVLIYVCSLVCSMLGKSGIGAFTYYVDMPYCYNHLLCLTGALGLFGIFKNLTLRKTEGFAANVIYGMASCTLGIYMIHEHPLIRYEWPDWLKVSADRSTPAMLAHMAICVVAIFFCGLVVEKLRQTLFEKVAGKKEKA